jgi:hypothetical protein
MVSVYFENHMNQKVRCWQNGELKYGVELIFD